MWLRRTFHDCAEELNAISTDFRAAHTNRFSWDRSKRDKIMLETSQRGVEVLRILALSVRGDLDFGLTRSDLTRVGALRSKATRSEVVAIIHDYHPPHERLVKFTPLGLRQALNKIAHSDPSQSGFFADNDIHDLILSGVNQGDTWIAVISLVDLCRVIKTLPDVQIHK